MRRIALPLALALTLVVGPSADEEARVTVLHTTDVHGAVLP